VKNACLMKRKNFRRAMGVEETNGIVPLFGFVGFAFADGEDKSAFVPLDDFFRPNIFLMGLIIVDNVDAACLDRDMFMMCIWVDP
jgi:hypothetical protein